ncbi:MAG: hypothetical protein OZSIB_3609 [Candidatus Ozemobacter sibiricus]|jgi:uncharacterized membrane-anchored protein YitT (DUF2179 family)|uniref:DUF2179 domain-containing protein n=1 Tax=Candidatus Ozemobacter sibiricus TaxID=2268124 RepID=A0A367ZPN8_9BACT|nr:MAG: hypothetical protein OZSIB_3609 [Candidatus Ozemobacter sibiricus]
MSKNRHAITSQTILSLVIGLAFATFSQACFLIPNKIVPSGLTGLGTVLYHHAGLPIGLFTIACNVLLIGLQARLLGLLASTKTIIAIVVQGLFLDLCTSVFRAPRLADDPMLAAIYGGLLTGIGLSFIFRAGATLGGTDILAQLLQKFRQVPVGTTFLWGDIVVLGVAALVYGPNLALYAMIKAFIVSQTLDHFMEGSSVYRQVLIISREGETLAWGIIEELHRGVTYLHGRGAYTNQGIEVLLVAVRRGEVPLLEELVYQIDPHAFIIVTDARRVLGKGFEDLEEILDGQGRPVRPAPAQHPT